MVTHRTRRGTLSVLVIALALAGCGGGSSAPAPSSGSKLTGSPVKIGNVVDLTGPVPGLFKGAREASDAYVEKINSSGGLDGHPVELVTGDSQISCNGTVSAWSKVYPQVQAMVGSISALDGCLHDAKVFENNSGTPAIFQELNPINSGELNAFAPSPRPLGQSIGAYRYIDSLHPGAIKKLGVIVNEQTSFSTTELLAGLKVLGGAVAYTHTTNIAKQTDYTADIVKMRSNGVTWLTLDGMDIATINRILSAAKQQNWKPEVITSAPAYDGNFFSVADPAVAEGVYLPLSTALFLGGDKASSVGVAEYLQWLGKVHPDSKPDLFGANAWAAWELWFQAWSKAIAPKGPKEVRFALGTIIDFDAKGLLATASPTGRKPATCWMVAQIKGGDFVRLKPEDKGFSCEGAEFVPLS